MKRNPSRALAIGAGLVIVALTAAAFWLSYAHLAEVALAHGMDGKEVRAWAWPATLDLFIVAGELLMLRAALTGRVDWWAIGLTVVGSGSSIALNVAGVGGNAEPLDYVVAAVPPTAALLAFGALMRQIHQALAGDDEIVPRGTVEPVAEVTVERVDDDQPKALPEAPEVVPAGARMLPIVARPEPAPDPSPYRWDHIKGRLVDEDPPRAAPAPSVLGPFVPLAELAATAAAAEPDPVALLSVADVAKARGVAEGTVRSWVARDKLAPAQRDDDGRLLFHPDAVAALN
ncbi:DUF2637 domain-containing protein [Streptomyces ipomoeae]|uniref:DUF2637 domain-containing protein n=1 Tax=Streptomyces ipomoeae TaxID=103232 RepID=A0AAE9B3D1_9ACTN|nr:DUF2637 domain-containing protein [Streptomyces ipomoeae]TQE40251.1 DUF2637 domain-containing protein [Streptomyces ipomoeae]